MLFNNRSHYFVFMNWLIPLVLLAAAYVLFEAGLAYLAFLTVIALVLLLAFASGGRGTTARGAGGEPTIIESAGEEIPERLFIKVKPDWTGRWSGEYLFEHLGYALDNIGRGLTFILTGRAGKK